jgi:nucleosome binding factor SPN SPT16 subunit
MRPGFEGKRLPGEVEIHQNGLRYKCALKPEHRADVLFSNIKHLFFQPCDSELIVLIHCHLKDPVMIGKKKTRDIQFYREAFDAAFDETGAGRKKRLNYADEDELEAEQEERRRKAAVNQEFKAFSQKIMEASSIEVDVPFRELGFYGVPVRQNVLLQPTTECLVHLTDTPFFVVPLEEVEIANLERVMFGLKNFDLVFVFKDHSISPVHVNTIPMTSLEHVKEWLDSMDVVYSESKVNYNWSNIMKTINEDPVSFYEDGKDFDCV